MTRYTSAKFQDWEHLRIGLRHGIRQECLRLGIAQQCNKTRYDSAILQDDEQLSNVI